MDFFVDKSILNFIEPPPEKLAAMEERVENRFTVPQLETVIQEVKLIADQDNMISNRQVVNLFVTKLRNSRSFADNGGLPKAWMDFKQEDFERIVRNLDTQGCGKVNAYDFASCMILL